MGTEKETQDMNKMVKDRTKEVRKLRSLGIGVGDILQGDEGNGPDRILITAIGRDRFLCVWDYKCAGDFTRPESGNTTLSCRKWKKVGHITDGLPEPMSKMKFETVTYLPCRTCKVDTQLLWLNSMQVCEPCMRK